MPAFGETPEGGESSGGGISTRQRLALLASALTLLAAMVVVLVLSPRSPPAHPPRDLLGYGEAGVLAVVRVRGALEVWQTLAKSRFVSVARTRGFISLAKKLLRRMRPYLPVGLDSLVSLGPRLLGLDVAVFGYAVGKRIELTAVAEGKMPIKLDIPTERSEEYRGHSLHAVLSSPGQEVHLTWKGRFALLASTRPRLKKLVDRHLGGTTTSLAQDPAFQRAFTSLPAGDRALVYVNLSQALGRPPWSALQSPSLRGLLGEPASLACSIDIRRDGAKVTAVLLQTRPANWVARLRGWLGSPGRLRAPRAVPGNALAFGAIRLAPARLGERLKEPLPGWLEPLIDRVRQALPPSSLTSLIHKLAGEVVLGLAPGHPGPEPFWLAQTQVEVPEALRVLSAHVPGPLGATLREVSSLRPESVGKKTHLLVRELPRPADLAVGQGRRWLFGGSAQAARGFGASLELEGRRWKPSALAQEVFVPAGHLILWLDLQRLWSALRLAGPGRPLLSSWLRRLGSLPDGLLGAGAALRVYPYRLVLRAFVRFQDLP